VVLVIEEDDALREAIREALCSRNCRIDTAATAAEALRQVLFHTYQVVVSDLSLPRMDGLELARLLSRRIRSPHIVLLTENPDPEWVKKALVAGASRVLPKPLSLTALAREVEELGSRAL
jgi:two-component system capsular synthesis sensor histidine kinase RcsC